MRTSPVDIAVVGHTNTGKTSLLRTLSRDPEFGEVSDRPATTRDVRGLVLPDADTPLVALYDTPGLEDALGVATAVAATTGPDPVARIEAFLAGDHDRGRFEQEAKVLRQLLRSDAALVVIDCREPILAKHREELQLLAACGRPLLPVLNFVAEGAAHRADWERQLARHGLHVQAAFDTVVYEPAAERDLFEKLGVLLAAEKPRFEGLLQQRAREREALITEACSLVAALLIEAAGARERAPESEALTAVASRLHDRIRAAEQRCVDALLARFRFELGAYQPPALPLLEGRWALDPFDPEALKDYGIRTGSAAAAGGMAGLAIDAAVGGMSLGAAALLGAGIGAGWSTVRNFGRPWLDQLRGYQEVALAPDTLALLAARQHALLIALLRRGHASRTSVDTGAAQGWPSAALKQLTLRCRAHPAWSDPEEDSAPAAMREAITAALRAALPPD